VYYYIHEDKNYCKLSVFNIHSTPLEGKGNMRIINLLLVMTLLYLTGCGEQSSGINWDMPTPYTETVFHTKNIEQFTKDIKQATQDTISIRIHAGASLYKHTEIKRAVRGGQVAIGEVLISLLSNEDPLFKIDVLPLLATDYVQAKILWQTSRVAIEKALDEKGLKLLFAVPWPPQGLYSKKAIHSLDDIKGLKIRAYNAMLSRLVELMGGIPTTVQEPEIQQAFSTGIIDAMMTSPSTGVSSQAWDYVKYYYDFQAWIPKNMVIINKEIFAELLPATQEQILQAAAKAEERGWAMSAKETNDKIAIMAEHGVQIMQPKQKLKQELSLIRQQMAQEWLKEAGEEGKTILSSYLQDVYQHNLTEKASTFTSGLNNAEQPK